MRKNARLPETTTLKAFWGLASKSMHLHALILNVPLPFPGIAGVTFGQGPSHLKHNLQGDVHATPGDLQLLMYKEGKQKKTKPHKDQIEKRG